MQSLDLIVVGGGLAGLMTAALVAGTGRKVVVLERSSRAGGRAITQVERNPFNLGPHALYCRGPAFRLLQELGVPFTGGFPDARRGVLTDEGRSYAIPRGIGSVLASRLLTMREKATFLRLFATLPRLDTRAFDRVSLEDWIRTTAGVGNLARLIRTLCRVSTYVDDPAAVRRGGDRPVEARHPGRCLVSRRRLAGARRRPSGSFARTGRGPPDGCRVESVRSDADGVTVELASGEVLRGRTAVLAIDPEGAVTCSSDRLTRPLADLDAEMHSGPCGLPRRGPEPIAPPAPTVAFGLDRPLYYSVHSASAELAPEGVAVLHVMKYLGAGFRHDPEAVERELEAFLERLQPGWRDMWSRGDSCRG